MNAWPAPPTEAAFHGPAGEFVLRTEPHSEAHPMALLAQFIVAIGTACGRGAHYLVEADRHYPNEFCILVGPSAKGRICCAQHIRPYVALGTMLRAVECGAVCGRSGLSGATYFGRDEALKERERGALWRQWPVGRLSLAMRSSLHRLTSMPTPMDLLVRFERLDRCDRKPAEICCAHDSATGIAALPVGRPQHARSPILVRAPGPDAT